MDVRNKGRGKAPCYGPEPIWWSEPSCSRSSRDLPGVCRSGTRTPSPTSSRAAAGRPGDARVAARPGQQGGSWPGVLSWRQPGSSPPARSPRIRGCTATRRPGAGRAEAAPGRARAGPVSPPGRGRVASPPATSLPPRPRRPVLKAAAAGAAPARALTVSPRRRWPRRACGPC